jgi:large subunit ribosomal protein L25
MFARLWNKKTLKMKSVKIEGKKRSDLGKKATRQLRSEDQVPAVIYGGTETVHFQAPVMSFRTLVYTPEFQIADINVEGKDYRTIMKDIQFDVVTDELNHIDFLELVEDRKVVATLPIKFVGQPQGVKDGGRLELKLKSLHVRTYPKHLAEHIVVNIDNLQLHGNIRVQDVNAPDMEILNSPRIPVASVVTTRALRQEETAAAAPAAGAAAKAAPAAAGKAAPAAAGKAPAAAAAKPAAKK